MEEGEKRILHPSGEDITHVDNVSEHHERSISESNIISEESNIVPTTLQSHNYYTFFIIIYF